MKLTKLAMLILEVMIAGTWQAAEIYNKDDNKMNRYGKIQGCITSRTIKATDGDQSYIRFGLKSETQISEWLTGYGHWKYNVMAKNNEGSSGQA